MGWLMSEEVFIRGIEISCLVGVVENACGKIVRRSTRGRKTDAQCTLSTEGSLPAFPWEL
jgi:hypothetical protein